MCSAKGLIRGSPPPPLLLEPRSHPSRHRRAKQPASTAGTAVDVQAATLGQLLHLAEDDPRVCACGPAHLAPMVLAQVGRHRRHGDRGHRLRVAVRLPRLLAHGFDVSRI